MSYLSSPFSLPYKQGPWVTFFSIRVTNGAFIRRYSMNVASEIKE